MSDLVQRLRKRAEIRRGIPRSEPDRISDILEEAALALEKEELQRRDLSAQVAALTVSLEEAHVARNNARHLQQLTEDNQYAALKRAEAAEAQVAELQQENTALKVELDIWKHRAHRDQGSVRGQR